MAKFRGQHEGHDYNKGPDKHPEHDMTAEDYDYSDVVAPEILPGREFADIDGADDKFRDENGAWKTEAKTDFTYGNGGDFHGLEKIEDDTDRTGMEEDDGLIGGDRDEAEKSKFNDK